MSDQDTQWNSNEAPTQESNDNQVPEILAELVGSGKKYASVEDAMKSIPHAQSHIQTLESELSQLREDLRKRENTEELLAKFLQKKDEGNQQQYPVGDKPTGDTPVDPNAIAEMVTQRLLEKSEAEKRIQNFQAADQAMKKVVGEGKVDEYIKQRLASLGIGMDFAKSVAEKSPTAFLELMGVTHQQSSSDVRAKGSVATEAFGNMQPAQDDIKPVMWGATTSDIVSAWRAAGKGLEE